MHVCECEKERERESGEGGINLKVMLGKATSHTLGSINSNTDDRDTERPEEVEFVRFSQPEIRDCNGERRCQGSDDLVHGHGYQVQARREIFFVRRESEENRKNANFQGKNTIHIPNGADEDVHIEENAEEEELLVRTLVQLCGLQRGGGRDRGGVMCALCEYRKNSISAIPGSCGSRGWR